MKGNFLAIRISDADKEKIIAAANREHRTITNYVLAAVMEKIERNEREKTQ